MANFIPTWVSDFLLLQIERLKFWSCRTSLCGQGVVPPGAPSKNSVGTMPNMMRTALAVAFPRRCGLNRPTHGEDRPELDEATLKLWRTPLSLSGDRIVSLVP